MKKTQIHHRLKGSVIPDAVLADGIEWEDSRIARAELREMRARLAAVERILDAERFRRAEESSRQVYGCSLAELYGLRARRAELARDILPLLSGLKLPRSQAHSLARRIAARFFGLR